tara:strand:- start:433 stop:609 length:177 start_codon:yes stop_codon:yes gene_type:complete
MANLKHTYEQNYIWEDQNTIYDFDPLEPKNRLQRRIAKSSLWKKRLIKTNQEDKKCKK